MDRQIQYPAQIPLVEDMLNAQRNAMVGVGHLAGAAFGANTVAASGFACAPGEGMTLTLAPGALLAPGEVDASSYGTLAAVSSALVRQFISRDPVTLAAPAAGATYIVSVTPQTVDTDNAVLPFYNAADPSVTYAGEGNGGLAAPTVRRDEAVLSIGTAASSGSYPLWKIVIPAGSAAITASMISVASGAPFYPSLASVAPRIVAPFNAQLASAIGGYPLNAVAADTANPGTFWVSTADANITVPGATGANWKSLFDGLATEAWASGEFATITELAAETDRANASESNLSTAISTVAGNLNTEAQTRADADALKANLAGGNALTGNQTLSGGGTFRVGSTLDGSSMFIGMDGTNAGQAILVVEDAEGNITNVLRLDGSDLSVNPGTNFKVISKVDGSYCRFTMDGSTGTMADLVLVNPSGAIANVLRLMSDGTASVNAGTLATTSQLPFVNSDTNLRIQAFTVTGTGGITTVTFPIAFRAGTVPVVVPIVNQELDGNARYTTLRNASSVPNPITNTSFVVMPIQVGGGGASISTLPFVMQVIAIGYI